jgi:hypothetical protein
MASTPSFDPSQLSPALFSGNPADSPLLNRATQGLYPPGSTFKIALAAEALDQGFSGTLQCPAEGFTTSPRYPLIRDHEYYSAQRAGRSWGGHGNLDLTTAFVESSNVFFAQLGVKYGHDAFRANLERLLFGQPVRIYPGLDRTGAINTSRVPRIADKDRYGLAQASIGQGVVTASPAHLALITAAVANQGVAMKPRLIATEPPAILAPLMSEATAGRLAKMMRRVVTTGTGKTINTDKLAIAGKTGTAENPHGASHGWFVGFAPADRPAPGGRSAGGTGRLWGHQCRPHCPRCAAPGASAGADAMKVASPWDRRRPERELLLICLGGIGLGFILVMGSLRGVGTPLGLAHLLPFLLYALSLAGLHLALVMAGFRGDQILVVAVAFLTGFGLLAQTRLGAFAMGGGESGLSDYAFVGGLVIMLAIALGFMSGRYRTLAEGHWVWVWAGISLLLVLVVLVTGQRFRGAVFGAGLITPTELLKVGFVLFAAAYIDRQAKALGVWVFHGLIPPWRPLAPLVGVWVALVLLLLVQRDLGMVMMLGLILPILLTLGTGRWGYLGLGLGGAGLLGWLLLAVFQHGERRIQALAGPLP